MENTKGKIHLKDIFSRNLLLILLIQTFSDCSLSWANSFINMGATAAGISVAAVGVASSVYSIVALIGRMPAGALADSEKKRIALIGAIAVRTILILFLGTFGMNGDMNFIVARGLYGLGWCLVGIILPAIVAMLVDKKVFGTTYAFLGIVQDLAQNYSKAGGVKMYQTFGMVPALLVAAGFAVVAILLTLLLDMNDEKFRLATPKKKRGGGLKALNLKYVPVCLMLSGVVLGWSAHNQFNNVIAEERGIDIASILVITGTVAAFVKVVASILCDFIHPKFVLFFLYVCLGAGILVTGHAYTYGTFLVAELLCTIGRSYSRIISIFLFKNCDPTEKGSVHATNYFCTDILSMIVGAVLGVILGNLGYQSGYDVIGFFTLAVAVVFILFGSKLMQLGGKKEGEEANA